MAIVGRKRKHDRHLPKRWYHRFNAYYYVEPTGKWIRLGGTLEEAHRAFADLMAGVQAGKMDQIFGEYYRKVLPEKSPKSQKEQGKQLGMLRKVFGELPIGAITSAMVARYLEDRGAPIIANREIALLSHVFTKAIKWRYVSQNPCIGVERNKEKPRRHRISDQDLMTAWMEAKPFMRALMALAYVTGQDKMDIARWRETDFDHRGLNHVRSKTKKEIPLDWTLNLKAARDYAVKVRPITPISRLLVCNSRGQGFSDRTLRKEWDRVQQVVVERGGIRFQFRDLRPRSATDHSTGDHLGHADRKILEKHYRLDAKRFKPI